MSISKYIWVLVVLFVSSQFTFGQGKVKVEVSTNVKNFTCECGEGDFVYEDTVVSSAKKIKLLLPVVAFDCPKRLMEKDLQELFDASKFPYVKLTVLEFNAEQKVLTLELAIKQEVKVYKVVLENKTMGNKSYLSGNQQISLLDFNVEPPKKMMGLVKVDDEVTINFLIPEKELLAY